MKKDESKLQQLNKEIAELKEQETSYKAKWQSEKELVNKIQQNKQEIEQLKFEAEKAEREGDYGKVAENPLWKITGFRERDQGYSRRPETQAG